MILLDVLVDHHGHLGKGQGVLGGYQREVGVILEPLQLGLHYGIIVLLFAHFLEQLAQIEGFHVDAVLLHGDLVKAHGLEGGGAGTDAAQIEPFHAIDHPADGGEVTQVLLEGRGQGMHHMGLHHGEGHVVLAEHIRHGELAAVSVPAVLEVHLADLVRIGLHQNGHTSVLQGGDGAVFVRENGHGEDHAVILALVLLEPFGVQAALVTGFHAAETGQLRIHGDVVIARIGDGLDHILTGTVDQFARHEAAVAETKGKGHLFHGVVLLQMVSNWNVTWVLTVSKGAITGRVPFSLSSLRPLM